MQGVGTMCNFDDSQLPNVIFTAAVVGVCGASFNHAVLYLQGLRARYVNVRAQRKRRSASCAPLDTPP
eukprot:3661472-Prymnesium_polylepis.1